MTPPILSVIDASSFPIVQIHGPSLAPSDGQRIIDDLEALIAHGRAFVLLIVNGAQPTQHQHDDSKARMLWLKENKARLASVCKGIVSVMPDSQRMPLVVKQAAGLQAALGLPFFVTASHGEATVQANALL